MSAGDTARASYMAVRTEIMQRMQLRDYVLLVFLGFTGVIFGVAFGSEDKFKVLFSLPFLSLGAAVLIAQHNLMAAVLGKFLAEELGPIFKVLNENAPQWDHSATFKEFAFTAAIHRYIGHTLIIFVPCVIALTVTFHIAFNTPIPEGHIWSFIWWCGLACVALSIYVIWVSHNKRDNIYKSRVWEHQKFRHLSDLELNEWIKSFKGKVVKPSINEDELFQQLEFQQLECEKFRRLLQSENE